LHEGEVAALFERVEREHGRLDILVNSIAGEDPMMAGWSPFWKANLANAEALVRQGLISRLITAKHAARLMIDRRRGFMAEVTENDLLLSSGDVVAQLLRISHKVLAAIYAAEMRQHGVVAIAITPGFLRSERMQEYLGVTAESWRNAGEKDRNFLESESPGLGRARSRLLKGSTIDRPGDAGRRRSAVRVARVVVQANPHLSRRISQAGERVEVINAADANVERTTGRRKAPASCET
jgi:NAD(P)-dependent dehydrogenase (short-subunit alcohol dehydrogenase family)